MQKQSTRPSLTRLRAVVTALLAALLLAFITPSQAHANSIELVDGHTDAIYVYPGPDGNPAVAIKYGLRGKLYSYDTTVIAFGADTYSDSYSFSQLGEYGTEGYYALGNTEEGPEDFMHPGFANAYPDAEVKFTVTKLETPGIISVFDNPADETAPRIPFLPGGKFFIEEGTEIPIPGHKHLQWYFSHAGLYKIHGYATVTGEDQNVQRSAEVVLTYNIKRNEADTRAPWQLSTPPAPEEPPASEPPASEPPASSGDDTANTPGGNGSDSNGSDSNGSDNSAPGNTGDSQPPATTPDQGSDPQPDNNAGANQPKPDTPKTDAPQADNPANNPQHTQPSTPPTLAEVYPPNSTKVVINRRHVDAFHLSMKGGSLHLDVSDDSAGLTTKREAADVILAVTPNTKQQLPPVFAQQTGLTAGYYLDENGSQQETQIFPGWDSLALGDSYKNVRFNFERVTGPGKVFLFKNKRLGGISPALGDTAEVAAGAVLAQKQPAHEHGHWIFEKPGVYTMQVSASAEDANGKTHHAAAVTYTWVVGVELPQHGQQDNGSHTGSVDNQSGTSGSQAQGNAAGSPSASNLPQAKPHTPAAQPVVDNACYPKTIRGAGPISLHGAIKDDRTAPANWVNPGDLSFAIGGAGKTKTTVPVGAIASGSDVWMISSTQVAGVPWLGVNTQHPSIIEQAQGNTTLTLTGFTGPGKMEVFTSGGFGSAVGERWFSGAPGGGSGSVSLSWNSHVHPNWVFDTPGQYRVTLSMTTRLNSGAVVNGSGTLVFNVGGGAGVTGGHFDFGPRVGTAGDKIVWETKAGKTCVPTAAELAAAGYSSLAATGAQNGELAFSFAAMLSLASLGLLRYGRKRAKH